MDTYAEEEEEYNENVEMVEKKVHIHNYLGKKLIFDEEYQNEGTHLKFTILIFFV